MYEELIMRLMEDKSWIEQGTTETEHEIADHLQKAANAIEELSHYAAQMDKLREDGWYLLQETAGTYGPITMKMPIPEPLSCDDVLAIINGEPSKEKPE